MRKSSKLGTALSLCLSAAALNGQTNSYRESIIASNIPGMGFTDTEMINTWGMANVGGSRAGGDWFVADNASGFFTITDANRGPLSNVTVSPANGTGIGSPAGVCVDLYQNVTFATLDGTISAYIGGDATTIEVNNSEKGAVYTGCTRWKASDASQALYVANSAGGVEAYDGDFSPITLAPGAFVDPNIPAGFTPYGVYATYQQIWVSFFNGSPEEGQGYVDACDHNGRLLLSLLGFRGSARRQIKY